MLILYCYILNDRTITKNIWMSYARIYSHLYFHWERERVTQEERLEDAQTAKILHNVLPPCECKAEKNRQLSGFSIAVVTCCRTSTEVSSVLRYSIPYLFKVKNRWAIKYLICLWMDCFSWALYYKLLMALSIVSKKVWFTKVSYTYLYYFLKICIIKNYLIWLNIFIVLF